jgi:hypothetical protein
MGHGFRADYQRRIALPTRNGENGMTKRNTTRGAGTFNLGARNVWQAQPIGDHPGQYFLTIQRTGDKVTKVKCPDFITRNISIGQRLRGGLDGKRFNRCADMVPKGS